MGRTAMVLTALIGLSAAWLPLQTSALTLTGAQLGALAPDSGSANFSTAELPALVLTVTETAFATMVGSDLDGYQGLWLGSLGNGGRYTFSFNQTVQSVTLSFIALTTLPEGAESLRAFEGDRALALQFASADGTAAWDGSTLTALEEDSRATLQFSAFDGGGFASLSFTHLQPVHLQGLVVDRIDFLPLAVPESPTVLMLVLGGAAMVVRSRRLAQQRAQDGLSV